MKKIEHVYLLNYPDRYFEISDRRFARIERCCKLKVGINRQLRDEIRDIQRQHLTEANFAAQAQSAAETASTVVRVIEFTDRTIKEVKLIGSDNAIHTYLSSAGYQHPQNRISHLLAELEGLKAALESVDAELPGRATDWSGPNAYP